MPDYLSCGGCQSDFELSDILQFIEHKRYNCNVTAPPDFAMELLECVKCLRKFHTPWPLLLHVQSEHHITVVRNLVLPSLTSSMSPRQTTSYSKGVDTKTAQTQTVKTCLKRLVCPYQTDLPSECCLKVEAPSEESCCCLETGEKTDSPLGMIVTNSADNRYQSSTRIVGQTRELSCNRNVKSQRKLSCSCESDSFTNASTLSAGQNSICCNNNANNTSSKCNRFQMKARVQSCCDPTQTLLPLRSSNPDTCMGKNDTTTVSMSYQQSPVRKTSCCPCKPNSNTIDQTCQTDFVETFDIDMDLLLNTNDLNVAIDSTFHEETNTSKTMLAPSKAIQTVMHGSNLGNYSISSQNLIPTEIMSTTNDQEQTGTQSFHSSSVSQSGQVVTQSVNNYHRTYSAHEEDVRASFIYNNESTSTLEQINTGSPPQIWENQEVSDSAEVDHSESLLHLLSSSPSVTATSFTKSQMSQRHTAQYMQSSHITIANRGQHVPRLEHMEPKRKRNVRDYRFNCSDCDKVFRQNVHLRKHIMAKHTKQKPHKCTYCRYTTVEKSHLTVHIRTHTGEKPFRCRICNYSTAQNCTLKSHYLRKHPDSKVRCVICGSDFITNHERDKHEKVCRREDPFPVNEMRHAQENNFFQKISTNSGNDLTEQPV